MNLPTPPEAMNKELYKLNMAEERLMTKVNQLITFSHELVEYLEEREKETITKGETLEMEYASSNIVYFYSPEAPQEKEWCACGDSENKSRVHTVNVCHPHNQPQTSSPNPESEVDVKALLEEYADLVRTEPHNIKEGRSFLKRMSEIEEIIRKNLK